LPADGSQGVSTSTSQTAQGSSIGYASFVPAPADQLVPQVVIPVAPDRPPHPEIPADSFFAIQTPDKPLEIFQKEEMGLRFSLESSLTIARTEEILKVNGWDYDRAMAQFLDFRARNLIPRTEFFR